VNATNQNSAWKGDARSFIQNEQMMLVFEKQLSIHFAMQRSSFFTRRHLKNIFFHNPVESRFLKS